MNTNKTIIAEIYHGSCFIMENPVFNNNVGYNKDFGEGFYCTILPEQANKWAKVKADKLCLEKCYVSTFKVDTSSGNFNIMKFDGLSDEWLDFIADCRAGKPHKYDIVEGPLADDYIYKYVNDYLNGDMPKEVFMYYAKFQKPTHQISFNTEKSLKALKFKRCYEVVSGD